MTGFQPVCYDLTVGMQWTGTARQEIPGKPRTLSADMLRRCCYGSDSFPRGSNSTVSIRPADCWSWIYGHHLQLAGSGWLRAGDSGV